jgi:hypothetical protein
MRTIRNISPGSVFKVAFVIYVFLLAIFGCLFFVAPAMLGSSMVASLARQNRSLAFLGSGTAVIILYVVGVVGVAIVQAIVATIGAIIYNIVARLVGGIRIKLEE